MKNIEIEIQVSIENNKPLFDFLAKNAHYKSERRQIDEYFSPAHRNFLELRPLKEWLRLRNSGGNYSINYKNWHFDENGKSSYCDEYETKIEDINKIRKIFNVLNFKQVVLVDKLRKAWVYKDYEVSIDSVKNLGDFVEIEYIGNNENADAKMITGEMINFLKDIGCGKIKRNYVGYPFQLMFPNEVKYEDN